LNGLPKGSQLVSSLTLRTGNTMRFHGMRMDTFASFSLKGSESRAWQVRGYLG